MQVRVVVSNDDWLALVPYWWVLLDGRVFYALLFLCATSVLRLLLRVFSFVLSFSWSMLHADLVPNYCVVLFTRVCVCASVSVCVSLWSEEVEVFECLCGQKRWNCHSCLLLLLCRAVWPYELLLIPRRRHIRRFPELTESERDSTAPGCHHSLISYCQLFFLFLLIKAVLLVVALLINKHTSFSYVQQKLYQHGQCEGLFLKNSLL